MDETREELERRLMLALRDRDAWQQAAEGLQQHLDHAEGVNRQHVRDAERAANELAAVRAVFNTRIGMLQAERRASADLVKRLKAEQVTITHALRACVQALNLIADDVLPDHRATLARRVCLEAEEVLKILNRNSTG